MRNLRWAAERATSGDERKGELGVAQPTAPGESDLLDAGARAIMEAALRSVVREFTEQAEDVRAVGDASEVVELFDDG